MYSPRLLYLFVTPKLLKWAAPIALCDDPDNHDGHTSRKDIIGNRHTAPPLNPRQQPVRTICGAMLIRAQGVDPPRLSNRFPSCVDLLQRWPVVEPCLAPRCAPSARSVPDASFFQFIGDLLFASVPNDRDLVRRSWHSIQRERRGKRLLLDIARSEDRDLVWTDGETRSFVLW